jgi:RimJ/RimL family protein N-acetyltransferase
MSNPFVRDLGDADVERVLDALAAVVDEGRWLGMEPPLDRAERAAQLRSDLTQGSRAHKVAVAGDVVVGHAATDLTPYGVANLSMFVVADWRRRGVGGALVAAAIAAARERNAHKLALQVWPHNYAARALYSRLGFLEEGRLRRHYRRRNGELWDAVVMGLVLDEGSPGSPYDL